MTRKLLAYVPDHHTYVEPFGGAAALLFAKPPSPVEVYNDVSGGSVNLFRVIRNPETFEAFRRLVGSTLYSREEYNRCLLDYRNGDDGDSVRRAWRFYVIARFSFGGRFGSGIGMIVRESQRGMAHTCSAWLGAIDRLPEIHERLMRVQIEKKDFRGILNMYDTENTLFYVDPPYVSKTRKSGRYEHELTDNDHEELITRLCGISGMALLSGYRNPLYDQLGGFGWKRVDWKVSCSAAGRTRQTGIQGKGSATRMQPRTESLWISPRALDRLNAGVDQRVLFSGVDEENL